MHHFDTRVCLDQPPDTRDIDSRREAKFLKPGTVELELLQGACFILVPVNCQIEVAEVDVVLLDDIVPDDVVVS